MSCNFSTQLFTFNSNVKQANKNIQKSLVFCLYFDTYSVEPCRVEFEGCSAVISQLIFLLKVNRRFVNSLLVLLTYSAVTWISLCNSLGLCTPACYKFERTCSVNDWDRSYFNFIYCKTWNVFFDCKCHLLAKLSDVQVLARGFFMFIFSLGRVY